MTAIQPQYSRLRKWVTLFSLVIFCLAISMGITPAAKAAILYTADTSGSVIVQSRRTLRDQERRSWQVIVFKPIQADSREGEVYLRLVGFPGAIAIADEPLRLSDPKGNSFWVANISEQIATASPQPHVGQYDLQATLANLPTDYRLQLDLPTLTQPVTLQISPAQIEEWQTIANIHHQDIVGACNKFPVEARHNPNFPQWVNCQADPASD